jgi:hypothetical protein
VDSGLNSCVLANNNEMILLPVNEPTYGTRRKSQIQTYLEQNEVRRVPACALQAALLLLGLGSTWNALVLRLLRGADH